MKHAFAIVAVLLGGLATFSAGCRLSDPSCDLQSTETESATNPASTASETEGGSDTGDVSTDIGSDTIVAAPAINITVQITVPAGFVATPLKLVGSFYQSLPATGMPGWMVYGPDVTAADIGLGKTYTLTLNTAKPTNMAIQTPMAGTVYLAVALLTQSPAAPVNCKDWAGYIDTPINLDAGLDVNLGTVELAIFDPKNDCADTESQ